GHLPHRRWRYRLDVPADRVGVVGHRPVRRASGRQVVAGVHESVFLPVMLAPQMHVERSGPAVLLTPQGAPKASSPDYPHHLQDLMHPVDRWAREHLMESLALGFAM